jgi:hypothetical protein
MLFTVNSAGFPLRSNLIFAEDINMTFLKDFCQTQTLLHQTKRGWMDKALFTKIMNESILPDIEKIREKLPVGSVRRGLLLLDGHSSRVNLELMKELSRKEIDVVVFPSHTSSLTQPLDRSVNGRWKHEIRTRSITFPKRKNHATELLPFVRLLEHCAHFALAPETIRKGFTELGIGPDLTTKLLANKLEHGIPVEKTEAQKNRFTICGKCITTPSFLKMWTDRTQPTHEDQVSLFATLMKKVKRKDCFQLSKDGRDEIGKDSEQHEFFEEDLEECSNTYQGAVTIKIKKGTIEEEMEEEEERKKMMRSLLETLRSERKEKGASDLENDPDVIELPANERFYRASKRKARTLMEICAEDEAEESQEEEEESEEI